MRAVISARPRIIFFLAFLAVAALAAVVGLHPAQAGLLGDTVTASLENLDTNTLIFSGSAVVVDPGIEFTGIFVHSVVPAASSTWTLDLVDLGFTLTGTCSNDLLGCDFESGATLTLTGLDFAPAASLVGLLGIAGELAAVAESPVVTPSSVTITFDAFTLGTSGPLTQSYSARFGLEPVSTVPAPVPAALLLVLAGGVGLGLLARTRR